MLSLVATPIGNLEDISHRAISTLKNADYILAEDTRHSLKLLHHLGIEKKLISFHDLNERKKQDSVIEDLLNGIKIALISDAGTPLVSDPGFPLVQECIKRQIPITSIPGPSAVITALVLSGFSPAPFQFTGFLPKKAKELEESLKKILAYEGTSVMYESPHRIEKTLQQIATLAPERHIALARELTKRHEEVRRGTAPDILQNKPSEWLGEMVLVIEGEAESTHADEADLPDQVLSDFVQSLVHHETLSLSDAIQRASHTLGINKRLLYRIIHQLEEVKE